MTEGGPPQPAPVLAQSVGFLISRLGFHCAGRFQALVAEFGLDPRQFAVLRHAAANQGQSQQALSSALGVPASALVALIDSLEERGLLERRANPADRRARALHLTTRGRRLVAKAANRAAALDRELCAALDDEEREQLVALLTKVAGTEQPLDFHPGLLVPFTP